MHETSKLGKFFAEKDALRKAPLWNILTWKVKEVNERRIKTATQQVSKQGKGYFSKVDIIDCIDLQNLENCSSLGSLARRCPGGGCLCVKHVNNCKGQWLLKCRRQVGCFPKISRIVVIKQHLESKVRWGHENQHNSGLSCAERQGYKSNRIWTCFAFSAISLSFPNCSFFANICIPREIRSDKCIHKQITYCSFSDHN